MKNVGIYLKAHLTYITLILRLIFLNLVIGLKTIPWRKHIKNIKLFLKFNQRPKFIINKKRKKIAEDLYEKYKTDKSVLMLGN